MTDLTTVSPKRHSYCEIQNGWNLISPLESDTCISGVTTAFKETRSFELKLTYYLRAACYNLSVALLYSVFVPQGLHVLTY